MIDGAFIIIQIFITTIGLLPTAQSLVFFFTDSAVVLHDHNHHDCSE